MFDTNDVCNHVLSKISTAAIERLISFVQCLWIPSGLRASLVVMFRPGWASCRIPSRRNVGVRYVESTKIEYVRAFPRSPSSAYQELWALNQWRTVCRNTRETWGITLQSAVWAWWWAEGGFMCYPWHDTMNYEQQLQYPIFGLDLLASRACLNVSRKWLKTTNLVHILTHFQVPVCRSLRVAEEFKRFTDWMRCAWDTKFLSQHWSSRSNSHISHWLTTTQPPLVKPQDLRSFLLYHATHAPYLQSDYTLPKWMLAVHVLLRPINELMRFPLLNTFGYRGCVTVSPRSHHGGKHKSL